MYGFSGIEYYYSMFYNPLFLVYKNHFRWPPIPTHMKYFVYVYLFPKRLINGCFVYIIDNGYI